MKLLDCKTAQPSRFGSSARFCAFTCMTLFGAACSDGYPENSEPVLRPAEMSQSQRLELMNQMGQRANLDARWRYKLAASCELTVTTGSFFAKNSIRVALKEGEVVKSFDRGDKSYDVQLKFSEVVVPLLESANWHDSVSFFGLIYHVQRTCVPG